MQDNQRGEELDTEFNEPTKQSDQVSNAMASCPFYTVLRILMGRYRGLFTFITTITAVSDSQETPAFLLVGMIYMTGSLPILQHIAPWRTTAARLL